MVFIAQIDVTGLNAHDLRGNQQTFQKAVWIPLEVGSVFKGAGLAFVNIDRHHAGRRLVTHDAPLASCRKAGAAQTPQARIFHGLDDAFNVVFTIDQTGRKGITAAGAVHLIGGLTRCCT